MNWWQKRFTRIITKYIRQFVCVMTVLTHLVDSDDKKLYFCNVASISLMIKEINTQYSIIWSGVLWCDIYLVSQKAISLRKMFIWRLMSHKCACQVCSASVRLQMQCDSVVSTRFCAIKMTAHFKDQTCAEVVWRCVLLMADYFFQVKSLFLASLE